MAERPILTEEQYSRAERREGINHPAIDVLDRHLPKLIELNESFSAISGNREQFGYIQKNYGFLADALVEAGPYTLGPEELIAIWSRAMEVFPQNRYPRYRLAGMVASAYAVQGLENPLWKKFPRYYLESGGELPLGLETDKDGLLQVKERLGDIRESSDELNRYVWGTKESGVQRAADLAKRARDGDKEADRELDEIIALDKARQTPLLREFHENFGNGYIPLYFPIWDALRTFGIESRP